MAFTSNRLFTQSRIGRLPEPLQAPSSCSGSRSPNETRLGWEHHARRMPAASMNGPRYLWRMAGGARGQWREILASGAAEAG